MSGSVTSMKRAVRSHGARAMAIALTLAIAAPSLAQTSSTKVSAEALFDEGRKLVTAGKYAEACPKFEDSQKLDPSTSTLLNLANCYEKNGQTASAWETFREAASSAKASGRKDYFATAEKRAEALEAKLSRLTIKIVSPAEGMEIKRDGVLVTPSEWGAAIPIDPGEHALVASAPHRKTWTGSATVAPDGASAIAEIPALEVIADAPPEVPPPTKTTSPPPPVARVVEPDRSLSIVGLVVVGVGVIGAGIGSGFLVAGKSKFDDSMAHCREKDLCDSTGVSLRSDARASGNVATIAFSVSAVALVTGVTLWIVGRPSDSRRDSAAASTSVRLVPGVGGATLVGAF